MYKKNGSTFRRKIVWEMLKLISQVRIQRKCVCLKVLFIYEKYDRICHVALEMPLKTWYDKYERRERAAPSNVQRFVSQTLQPLPAKAKRINEIRECCLLGRAALFNDEPMPQRWGVKFGTREPQCATGVCCDKFSFPIVETLLLCTLICRLVNGIGIFYYRVKLRATFNYQITTKIFPPISVPIRCRF